MGWPQSTLDQRRLLSGRSFDGDFPTSPVSASAQEDLPFHAAGAASIGTTLCDDEGYKISSQCLSPLRRLHGGGCERKAKQIRSRNDAPVFPRRARSMGQIGSRVCVFTQGHPVRAVAPDSYAHREEVTG